MVDCPECGEPLVRGSQSRYYCENDHCSVIFVQCPHNLANRRVAYSSLTREEKIEKMEEVTARSRSNVF